MAGAGICLKPRNLYREAEVLIRDNEIFCRPPGGIALAALNEVVPSDSAEPTAPRHAVVTRCR